MSESWLPSLTTPDPEAGFTLAVKLSRMAVKLTQPDGTLREKLRPDYEADAGALIATSGVVATHFATIAAANQYWVEET
ncbi:hexameric tyrosine-coordinated heme protein [uncultured Tateyamaria sp.]|uniref:hexameric tyrosine-coordinated heme protein n=1 Tax=uncultured Tateyamaria sp. TaxID=455651 RepID=UPI0026028F46|nr:hexameric tyrosine-coordinated heme protein [uncultured Tateyamaria sp.]